MGMVTSRCLRAEEKRILTKSASFRSAYLPVRFAGLVLPCPPDDGMDVQWQKTLTGNNWT
jgi:hypothetical protein